MALGAKHIALHAQRPLAAMMTSSGHTLSLSIRNMVCDRCIRVVREELERLGLDVRSVELGSAVISQRSGEIDLAQIRNILEENGFELIEDRRRKLIESAKLSIIRLVHRNQGPLPARFRLSTYIQKETGEDYPRLSTLFSSVEGITIERFFILQRIERVKELLKYGDRALKDIAWDLGFSSTQHLSNQFKQVTGMTPSDFRSLAESRRNPIDKIVSPASP